MRYTGPFIASEAQLPKNCYLHFNIFYPADAELGQIRYLKVTALFFT